MAKLSNVQYKALSQLKTVKERYLVLKLVDADIKPYLHIDSHFNTKTINVLVRKGLVDTFLDKMDMVVQINSRGLEVVNG